MAWSTSTLVVVALELPLPVSTWPIRLALSCDDNAILAPDMLFCHVEPPTTVLSGSKAIQPKASPVLFHDPQHLPAFNASCVRGQ